MCTHPKKIHLVLATFGYLYKHVPPGVEETGLGEVCGSKQLKQPRMGPMLIESYLLAHPEARLFHTALDGVLQSFLYNHKNGDWISFDDEATLLGRSNGPRSKGSAASALFKGIPRSASLCGQSKRSAIECYIPFHQQTVIF